MFVMFISLVEVMFFLLKVVLLRIWLVMWLLGYSCILCGLNSRFGLLILCMVCICLGEILCLIYRKLCLFEKFLCRCLIFRLGKMVVSFLVVFLGLIIWWGWVYSECVSRLVVSIWL